MRNPFSRRAISRRAAPCGWLSPAPGSKPLFSTAAPPRLIIEKTARTMQGDADRAIARLLGAGNLVRTPIARDKRHLVDAALKRLLPTGRLRWRDGTPLSEGPRRVIRALKDSQTGK